MELSSLFKSLSEDIRPPRNPMDPYRMSDFTDIHHTRFPNWEAADIVIIGCDEEKGSTRLKGAGMAPDMIRKELYKLSIPRDNIKIADLGNLIKAKSANDYYEALALAVEHIVKAGKVLLILGSSQEITFGQYKGYQYLDKQVEYVHIDSELDVQDSDFGLNNVSFNHKIFLHSPNFLFNFTNLGYQSYFVSLSDRKRLKNLHFQALRLGELRNDLRLAEPFLRTADLVSFDLSAVRSSDAPGSTHPCPAGFTVEEACQLMRYAGMSPRVSSLSLTEVNPMKDLNNQTVMLTALMAWYFIDGVYNRKPEVPEDEIQRMQRYRIKLKGGMHEIVFYRNDLTGRWWMEVPYSNTPEGQEPRVKLVSCSEADYEMAREDEIPEKWWFTHHKLK